MVQDEIQADEPIDLWWFMHTPASVRIEDDGHTAILEQVGTQLRAEILSPPGATFQIMDAEPLPASPHPERQAKNERIRKLAIHLTGVSTTRLAVALTPNWPLGERSAQDMKLSALSAW